ncbi:MAG: hypothetical protein AB7G17_07325 [Phycisphaerales bacterium]
MKKVTITAKPANGARSSDQWVAERPAAAPTKRLTIDVPLGLHRRMKVLCAERDERMADVVRRLLESHFDIEREAEEGPPNEIGARSSQLTETSG